VYFAGQKGKHKVIECPAEILGLTPEKKKWIIRIDVPLWDKIQSVEVICSDQQIGRLFEFDKQEP